VLVPELAARLREHRAEGGVVAAAEERDVALGEDAEELVVRQGLRGHHLELREGDLAPVEVQRRHGRALDDVVERVAAGGRDGNDVVLGADVEHAAVDARVLPAHVVNVLPVQKLHHEPVVELAHHVQQRREPELHAPGREAQHDLERLADHAAERHGRDGAVEAGAAGDALEDLRGRLG